jgi:hypothetical protein
MRKKRIFKKSSLQTRTSLGLAATRIAVETLLPKGKRLERKAWQPLQLINQLQGLGAQKSLKYYFMILKKLIKIFIL